MKVLIVFSLMTVCVFGRYVSRADNNNNNNILNKCADGIQEFADCVKYKAIKLIDHAITNKKPIAIANFLYLTHDNVTNGAAADNMVADEEDALKAEDVDNKLTEVLIRRVRMLAQTKNLQIKLDGEQEQSEGRKKDKDKDKGGQMTMMMGAGAMMMHMAMSKIALIAGKALIVAKIALVISAVLALKKMMSQDDGHESTQVIYKQSDSGHGGGGGGGWHRSIDHDAHAHQMAYGGQVQDHHP
ncbi:uncharacterized protein LOC135841867 [Planococcus citri]|uniref:uncharacterized protein LOC135841867 n=1 Tax=Planococcus citri TaxID=170843 RepID=UPI0031F80D69